MIDATKLRLGVPLMDEQHAALVELFNVLEKPDSDLAALVPGFAAYAEFHFQEEEALMRRHGYPHLAAHVAEHEAYRATFARMMLESQGGPAQRQSMQDYIATWLAQHILGTDKAFTLFLAAAVGQPSMAANP